MTWWYRVNHWKKKKAIGTLSSFGDYWGCKEKINAIEPCLIRNNFWWHLLKSEPNNSFTVGTKTSRMILTLFLHVKKANEGIIYGGVIMWMFIVNKLMWWHKCCRPMINRVKKTSWNTVIVFEIMIAIVF